MKKQYGAKSDVPYKIMNKMGLMKGSKETKKGREAEKKHSAKVRSHSKIRGLGGEIHRPATRSRHQGHSFAENLTGARYK